MKDEDKPREQLISEITELRQQLGESKSSLEELKKSEAKYRMLAEATPAFVHVTQGKRRQTEDQLRAAHQQLSEIIEFLPDATLVIDKGRRVIAWNKAIEEMTGVRKEETIGKGNHAYAVPFYGEPRPILIDLVFMEDGETAQKYTYTEKVGDTIYAETFIPSLYEGRGAYLWVKASPLYSSEGLVTGAIESIRDITGHKRTEQEVREQLNFLQILIDTIPTPIYYKDPNEMYLGCNKAYEIMLDQPKENIVGKTAYDIWPKELADIYHRTDNELLSHSGVQVFDSKVRFADGLIHDVSFHKATYKNLTGHLAGLVGVFIDITERKRIEEMLRQTASELQAVFQALPDLYFRLSANGTFLDVQAGRLSDLYLPIEELLGKRIQDTSRRLAQQFQQAIDQTLRRRSLVMIEYALTIGGEKKFFEARFLPLLEDQVVVVVRNITERMQMEERLRKSEQEYRTIFETTSTAMVIAEDDTTISLANQEFARLSGYSIEEVEGKKSWIEFIGYGYLEMMKEYHRMRRSGSPDVPRQYEAEFIDRYGNIKSVLITATMIPATRKSVISFLDITERKHAEAELRQRAAELQAVFQALPDLYFRLSADGTFLDVQAGRLSDLYLPIEELLGKRIQDTSRRLAQQFQQAIDQTLRRRSLVMIEYALTIGGEKKFFEARFLPLLEDQVVVVVRNITERKRDEEELKKYREHLEVLVEQRTVELKAINKELESFSYSVSHDLRSPLRIIDGYSQVLEEDYLENLGNEGMKNIQIIRSQCQRMGELINDILDLSRLSRKEMQLQEVNLSQLAASIAVELQSMEPERQVNFIITPNLEVRGDKQLLQSVLENLMNNAWKFTSKHPQAKIKFGVKKNGGKKAYFVSDDGAGFDMKYAQKLFGAFQRLHTIGEFPGTGVGLAIVQRIVHRHGGQVWAEGAEEKGATFYFTLNRQISGRGNLKMFKVTGIPHEGAFK